LARVFTGLALLGVLSDAPAYFAFRLPTGQFIELYFQRDVGQATR